MGMCSTPTKIVGYKFSIYTLDYHFIFMEFAERCAIHSLMFQVNEFIERPFKIEDMI